MTTATVTCSRCPAKLGAWNINPYRIEGKVVCDPCHHSHAEREEREKERQIKAAQQAEPEPNRKRPFHTEQQILQAIATFADSGGATIGQLEQLLGYTKGAQSRLNTLMVAGKVVRAREEGRSRGRQYRYFLAEPLDDHDEDQLPQRQQEALEVVTRLKAITAGTVAAELGISKVAASGRLTKLIDKGLIRRVQAFPYLYVAKGDR